MALAATGVLFAGVALECGLRVAASRERSRARREAHASETPADQQWATYDPDLNFRGNPYFGDFNADGLRDHAIGPKAGRFRLVMLGDSIGEFGDNIDDTFVAYMRAELQKSLGSERVDVVNACIRGYTNYQELVYLKKYGLKFEPDLVGVEFCLNDLHKFLDSFHLENGQLVPDDYGRKYAGRPGKRRSGPGWMSIFEADRRKCGIGAERRRSEIRQLPVLLWE